MTIFFFIRKEIIISVIFESLLFFIDSLIFYEKRNMEQKIENKVKFSGCVIAFNC
jgi:hypothetical protein